jgi:hypothetical protein
MFTRLPTCAGESFFRLLFDSIGRLTSDTAKICDLLSVLRIETETEPGSVELPFPSLDNSVACPPACTVFIYVASLFLNVQGPIVAVHSDENGYLDCNNYRQFWISWANGLVEVGRNFVGSDR